MWLAEIWRYPVKSMAGEPLQEALVAGNGLFGDRVVHARNARGRVITSRTHPRLLGHRGTLGPGGEPLVDGHPWTSPEATEAVQSAAGDGAQLIRFDGVERFDVLPLLVATDGAIAAFGHDGRRLRPNLVIGGVPGLAERSWEGRTLRIGEVIIRAEDLRQRCVMTTFDPDTQEQDVNILRQIQRDFGGSLALNCHVVKPGTVRVGDPVELVDG